MIRLPLIVLLSSLTVLSSAPVRGACTDGPEVCVDGPARFQYQNDKAEALSPRQI